MRDGSQTVLERAFEVARSGEVEDTSALKTRLSKEGYEISQLEGSSLMRQLRDAIAAAPKREAGAGEE
jgi:hypothetical protein